MTFTKAIGISWGKVAVPNPSSRHRKLFRLAQASNCVPSTVKCSSESRPAARAWAYGAKKRPRLGRCWSSLPSSLRLCRLRCSSSSSRSLAG